MGKSKDKSYKCYYGIPHCHTAFSTGRGIPYDAYEYGKRKNLDYMVITDHNSYLSKDVFYNKKQSTKWSITKAMAEKFKRKNESCLPLVGFQTKTSLYGDFNVINSSTFFTGVVKDIKLLLLWMINNPEGIVTINHPHKNILSLPFNPLLNKVITSIEVGNGCYPNKYIRYDKYYYALLDKGWKLGAINSQDNHRVNFGDSENLTGVLCSELREKEIIEGFRERRTFSTESRSLEMYFTINDEYMGSIINDKSPLLRFMIYAEDRHHKILSIEILSNGGKVVKKIEEINLHSIKYMYDHVPNEEESWYVVRIHQENNKLALSSPIFMEELI